MDHAETIDLHELTTGIVCAYVSNNPLPADRLPGLIQAVAGGLQALSTSGEAATASEPAVELATAAQIRKSITPDALISFIDGKPYKTLKRHLTKHGLDPYGYRARYGLPADYPMTCPSYSAQRSELAKAIGLGSPGGMRQAAE
ncbi:MucR family transcriptional regulator [Methylobacterium soli]|uniref:MucR family transcriptional regulator n=1 Tax=Methylobacterium soli TaxID=553447 RepID=A0A6L3T341_9HYPH|nr:MucR family transcriptional regulator [Methylobacterium soli]KAB1079342.1 MucR family transcriptional regulator [Methylobacterium soli]GJE41287.1 Transcriptional regulatory protein ros [Methylobacterium soli]